MKRMTPKEFENHPIWNTLATPEFEVLLAATASLIETMKLLPYRSRRWAIVYNARCHLVNQIIEIILETPGT